MSQPILSVITPVLQGEHLIEACIQSVIAQRCDRLEHCIIDGGSKDETVKIVQRYAQTHPHIRWVSEKDQGQSDAMNKGVSRARGRYIGFLNADDYYEPNILNDVIDLLERLPQPGLLVGNCRVWGNDGKLIYINKPARLNVISILLGAQFPVNPSAYFYNRSLHDLAGAYNTEEHYSMDIDFILRVLPKANIKYVDRVLGNFRLVEGTKTFQAKVEGRLDSNRERIFQHFYQTLSRPQRLYVSVGRALRHVFFRGSYYARRVRHYLTHPHDLKKFLPKP
jgi:glycosyltransferase involved in cell wall biosynthesis